MIDYERGLIVRLVHFFPCFSFLFVVTSVLASNFLFQIPFRLKFNAFRCNFIQRLGKQTTCCFGMAVNCSTKERT